MYDPDVPPRTLASKEEYMSSNSKAGGNKATGGKGQSEPAYNHFYEKLLTLKDRMRTKTGKAMAESRHEYMVDYLERFWAENAGMM